MDIIKRLPDDLISYVIEYIPNYHIINKWSNTSMYLDKTNSILYVISISPYNFIKYRKSHILYVIKMISVYPNTKFHPTIKCYLHYKNIENVVKLSRKNVDILTTSWYVNKKYKDIVYYIYPPASIEQKLFNGIIQMTFICFLKYILFSNFNPSLFCLAYIKVFFTCLFIRHVYEKRILY
jgi:hypothetical protein